MLIEIRDIIRAIETIISQNQGYDIVSFEVTHKTIIAQFMIIASGNSIRHVQALSEYIITYLKQYSKIEVEGINGGHWIVMHSLDIMIHIFRSEVRDFYRIEELYS
ncbi:ribosome silencing factor [Wolbachia endosymbiont of Howardula sp.]|uniref:ribosome silencing factor n=1 Tax=Wolbachia endosymbiont of Howardula sp. TaxID=2916816 RepID=UPI00217D1175|nr:ribosome silencing factor [Wolbachia endosymbiont of Howardula sp.]UWI83316.1 ribosome silencing factor [Wolbachia endosymbiont of Howardula sp.]